MLAAFLYCLAGVLQAAWLSATPDYPRDRATFNALGWGGSVVTLGVLIFIIIRLKRLKRRED